MRSGDVTALAQLYDRYGKLVYGLAYRMLGQPEEAEDMTQEVFLTLWRRDLYDASRGSLKTLLATMTRSRCLDRLRSRESRQRFLARWQGFAKSETGSALPLEQAIQGERSHRVHEALAELSTAERQILEIAFFEGLSHSQISQRLGLPLGTVKSRARQGLLKLRKQLQVYFGT